MTRSILFSFIFLFSLSLETAQPVIISDLHFPNVFYNAQSLPQGISGAYTFIENKTPHVTALIAWDLNQVIFLDRYNFKEMLSQTAVIKKYGLLQTFTLLKDFGFLYRQKSIFKKAQDPRGYVWDAMFDWLEEQITPFNKSISNKDLADLLRDFSQQANHLDFELIHVLEKLEQCGHKNVVLSNMGQGLVDLQVATLKKQLTETPEDQTKKREDLSFALTFLTQPSNVISSKINGWLHKPDKSAYELCIKNNPIQSDDKVLKIFIDDKQENVAAAVKDGLFDIGIRYKNVSDLRRIFYYIFPHFVQSTSQKRFKDHLF